MFLLFCFEFLGNGANVAFIKKSYITHGYILVLVHVVGVMFLYVVYSCLPNVANRASSHPAFTAR